MALNGQKIDHTMLSEVKDAYQRISEREDEQINLEEVARKRDRYNEIYLYVYNVTNDWNLVYNIDADILYRARLSRLKGHWDDQRLTEREIAYWMQKEDTIEKPFTYRYADGWDKLLQEFLHLNIMLILAIAICLSTVFSDEHVKRVTIHS